MNLGAAGKALIRSFEKLRLTAYSDSGGVLTIGWGHTGPDVVPGLQWTPEQAEMAFSKDLVNAVKANNSNINVAVNQNQFDALVSFAYNVGIGAESHSTLLRLVNNRQFQAAAEEFLKWDHVNGREVPGLLSRRKAEQALFMSP